MKFDGFNKKYKIIYADPPWSYYNDSTVSPDCTTVRGMRRPPYKVMSSKDIAKLDVQKIADSDSVLFIWTTDYHLEKCLFVIKQWGFEYKTIGFAWQKLNRKSGTPVCFTAAFTMKSGIELCLLATKGKVGNLIKNRKVRALVTSVREVHSKKPDEVRTRITDLFGDLPRIELFARDRHSGWDAYGDQLP